MKYRIIAFYFLLNLKFGIAGCSNYELTLKQIIQNSDLIVKAQVLKQQSFYSNNKTFINTKHQLKIFEVYKGEVSSEIYFTTEGGMIDSLLITSSAEPNIEMNDVGYFFLVKGSLDVYSLSTASQSFFAINNVSNITTNGFLFYDLIQNDLANQIQKITGSKKVIEQSLNEEISKSVSSNPFINNFSPTTAAAGIGNTLIINGSGFGTQATGNVFFANADDGGATYNSVAASNIQVWTDSKIILTIPHTASTGKVWVQQNNATSISTQTITIKYARANVTSNAYNFKTDLVNESGAGGYLVSLNQNFSSDTSAKNSFLKALKNWRCSSFVNFTQVDSTSINTNGVDNNNVVRFAEKGELKPGVLGITYSYYISCANAYWYVKEFDMVFLDTTLWNLDNELTTNNQYDFLSVATHELGHAHQLSHVTDVNNLMHFSIKKGENKRDIDVNTLECANLIMADAKKSTTCGPNSMKPLNSNDCLDVEFTFYALETPKIYPNPTSSKLNIEYFLPSSTSVLISVYDMMGKLVFQPTNETLKAGKNSLELNIDDYQLKNGIYFIKLNALNKKFVSKFVVHH